MRHLKPLLLTVLAIVALTISCVDPFTPVPTDTNSIPEGALVLSPEILGVPATKATIAGDDLRNENKISTLDIFVYRKLNEEGATRFFHRYTLTAEEGGTLLSGSDYVLENDWRSARYGDIGYEGNTFKVYVLANMAVNLRPEFDEEFPESPDEDLLKYMISISKETISSSYDVVRLVDGKGPGDKDWYNPHIKDNLFLMDGVIDGWTPIPAESVQYFTKKADKTFELARAAAKFCVSLDFAPEFLATLGTADADKLNFTKIEETWPNGNKKVEVVTNIGNMQYKFANFMPVTYDFDPNTSGISADDLKDFRDDNLWESTYRYDFSYQTPITSGGYKYPYIDTTYSYAFSWDATESAEKAPALAASVVFTKTTNHYDSDGNLLDKQTTVEKETDYYRIPLVDVVNASDPVTEVKRNYFYQVEALITSMGASIIDIEPTKVKLNYKVIPWAFNPATDITEVVGAQLYYFSADTTYILRGENTQFVYLDYFSPKSAKLSNGLYEFEPVLSNVFVYYMPDADTKTPINAIGTGTYSDLNTKWTGSKASSGESVSIAVQPKPDGGGQVYITSDVLANRAVKYIEFDATVSFKVPILDGDGIPTGDYNTVPVQHHYLIKHFPLDNIQSVVGLWSSRWDLGDLNSTVYYRKKYFRDLGSTNTEVTRDEWLTAVGNSNDNRKEANSKESAINGYYATGGSQTVVTNTSTSFSGEIPTTNVSYSWNGGVLTVSGNRWNNWNTYTYTVTGFDYFVNEQQVRGNGNNRTVQIQMWKYEKYYYYVNGMQYSYNPSADGWDSYNPDDFEWEVCTQEQYNSTSSNDRKIEEITGAPSTGSWVSYNPQKGGTYRDNQGSNGYRYYAKVFSNNTIYQLNSSGSRSNTTVGLSNNHMYVIQISKAETGVVLGHPVLNTQYQSNDNVVSPAFMIASQLGAVLPFNSATAAATHCRTYMEVTSEGRRFVGWRLPTPAEIAYIVNYQNTPAVVNGGVFEAVVTGSSYYTLDGQLTETGYDTGSNYVRCVRDLTPEEVAELNSTGTITTATY